MMRKNYNHVYFVGIGGIGMSGIAEVLLNLGYQVSGSDLSSSEITRHLKTLGAKIYQGHRASNLGNCDVVVVSSAVSSTNPIINTLFVTETTLFLTSTIFFKLFCKIT